MAGCEDKDSTTVTNNNNTAIIMPTGIELNSTIPDSYGGQIVEIIDKHTIVVDGRKLNNLADIKISYKEKYKITYENVYKTNTDGQSENVSCPIKNGDWVSVDCFENPKEIDGVKCIKCDSVILDKVVDENKKDTIPDSICASKEDELYLRVTVYFKY